jgi:hypothetical protein
MMMYHSTYGQVMRKKCEKNLFFASIKSMKMSRLPNTLDKEIKMEDGAEDCSGGEMKRK